MDYGYIRERVRDARTEKDVGYVSYCITLEVLTSDLSRDKKTKILRNVYRILKSRQTDATEIGARNAMEKMREWGYLPIRHIPEEYYRLYYDESVLEYPEFFRMIESNEAPDLMKWSPRIKDITIIRYSVHGGTNPYGEDAIILIDLMDGFSILIDHSECYSGGDTSVSVVKFYSSYHHDEYIKKYLGVYEDRAKKNKVGASAWMIRGVQAMGMVQEYIKMLCRRKLFA